MVKNFRPSKVETSDLSSFWRGNKNFPLFSGVLKLKTLLLVMRHLHNYEKIKFLEKTQVFPPKISTSYDGLTSKGVSEMQEFSKKEPRAREEYNCQVGERSS